MSPKLFSLAAGVSSLLEELLHYNAPLHVIRKSFQAVNNRWGSQKWRKNFHGGKVISSFSEGGGWSSSETRIGRSSHIGTIRSWLLYPVKSFDQQVVWVKIAERYLCFWADRYFPPEKQGRPHWSRPKSQLHGIQLCGICVGRRGHVFYINTF